MQTKNESPKEPKAKLGLADFAALYQMSMRSFFWKIDGRQGLKQLGKESGNNILALAFYFMALIIAYGPIFCVVAGVLTLKFYVVIPGLIYMVLLSPVVFNFPRLKYNLKFTQSAWWKNTGVRPSQIKKDRGLYGEYIATMAAEQSLANSQVFGRVFNSVIVPKKDGDFNEIDVLSVNECGIHVIEAKARGGVFYGSLVGETWKQEIGGQVFEMQNPVLQNQNHINYLQEYLAEALSQGSARLKAVFPLNAANVVLFAKVEIEDHIDKEIGPREAFFGMAEGKEGYQQRNLRELFKTRFTKEETEEIIAAVEKIARHSQQELEQLKMERAEKNRQGQFRHPVSYYPVRLESPTLDGDTEINEFICREGGGYRTYLDPEDRLFKAVPAGRIVEQGRPCPTLEEAQGQQRKGPAPQQPARRSAPESTQPLEPEAPKAPPAPEAPPVPPAPEIHAPAAPEARSSAQPPAKTAAQGARSGQAAWPGQAASNFAAKPSSQAKR